MNGTWIHLRINCPRCGKKLAEKENCYYCATEDVFFEMVRLALVGDDPDAKGLRPKIPRLLSCSDCEWFMRF